MGKECIQFKGISKLWTKEHSENADVAPAHRNSLTPRDIRIVIEAYLDSKTPESPTWKFVLR
jgi:hypothetical protein